MSINPFTVTALIGPSGCGKSTFLRVFNRMNDYIDGFRLEGEVLIDDQDIYKEQYFWKNCVKKWEWFFKNPIPFPNRFTKMPPMD